MNITVYLGALAGFLMQRGVDTLICGGIGGGAQAALAQAGITLYGGVCGAEYLNCSLCHKKSPGPAGHAM